MAKRRKAKRMARRGATRKEIRQETGLNKRQARRVVRNYRPAPTPSAPTPSAPTPSAPTSTATSTPTPTNNATPEIRGARQGLRIAGVGGISGSDLKTIQKATGKSGAELIQKLDKINKNLKGKDKTGISLNAGAANRLIKKATKKQSRNFGFMPTFGEGRIGKTLTGMLGTPGSSGRYVKGKLVGARDAVAPTLLTGGMQIRPGGRERVQGFGKQYEAPTITEPVKKFIQDTSAPGYPDRQTDPEPVTPEPVIPEPEPVDTSLPSEFSGFDLASWATGFRRARSSRRRAGRKAQGLASQKKSPFKSWKK